MKLNVEGDLVVVAVQHRTYTLDFVNMTDWRGDTIRLRSDNEWEWQGADICWQTFNNRTSSVIHKAHKYWCNTQAERILLNIDKVSV